MSLFRLTVKMAMWLQSCYVPITLPLSLESCLKYSKSIRTIGIVIGGVHYCWKLLRKLSLSGKSRNPIKQYLHSVLRNYLNHGFLIRSEFSVQLPWQFYVIFSGRYVIVNYGSYGTVPKTVMQHHFDLQNELEFCPDLFNRITLVQKYEESRQIVAKAVGCKPENMVFTDNITEGMNCTLRSLLLDFDENDAVLCLNLNYSAILKTAAIHTKLNDVKLLQLDLKFPIASEDEVCNLFEDMFKKHPNIKLAIFDHITSASAVKLPIEKLASLCRHHGVISVVDGAHAPGQLFINIENYGADIYIGNLHKWYYTPKSCAVMYINPKFHDRMQPSLVSHGCYGDLHERFRRQATKNYSAHITAGYAVGNFMVNLGGVVSSIGIFDFHSLWPFGPAEMLGFLKENKHLKNIIFAQTDLHKLEITHSGFEGSCSRLDYLVQRILCRFEEMLKKMGSGINFFMSWLREDLLRKQ